MACKDDRTTKTAKRKKENDIRPCSARYRHYVSVMQCNITFYFCSFNCVIFICIVVLASRCKLLSFFLLLYLQFCHC